MSDHKGDSNFAGSSSNLPKKQEKGVFFYPRSIEELLNQRPSSILKEKELNFDVRKINMEREAVRQEKSRTEKERSERFDEKEFEFKGEVGEPIIPEKPSIHKFDFKTALQDTEPKPLEKGIYLAGYANIQASLRDQFKINKKEKPNQVEFVEFVKFNAKTHPMTFRVGRKHKIRKLDPDIKNLYDISTSSILTGAELGKRAEILAKLYMKTNYDEEKYKKEADADAKKKENTKKKEGIFKILEEKEKEKIQTEAKNNAQSGAKGGGGGLLPPPNLLGMKPGAGGGLLPPPNLLIGQSSGMLPPPNINLLAGGSGGGHTNLPPPNLALLLSKANH